MQGIFGKTFIFALASTLALKCHIKRNKLPAKEKLLRQKKNAHNKKEIGHGKRKNHTVKQKFLRQKKDNRSKRKNIAAKEKCSRQKRNRSR